MIIIERLKNSILSAAEHNKDLQVPPACILWPDKEGEWESVMPRLQAEMPELLVLGHYDPEKRTGPAIWLRCAIAGTIEDLNVPHGTVPILYLPGVSRQDLKNISNCPDLLKPMIELQYRGTFWSQVNSKDWTILAFLMTERGGLGLDVAQDKNTLSAMRSAITLLLDEKVENLKGKRLDRDWFNALLTGDDPIRELLLWMDDEETFRNSRREEVWQGFVDLCKSKFSFDPENDGKLTGAEKLARHEEQWLPVWERFCEAPKRYPMIPSLLRNIPMPDDLFTDRSGWPLFNEKEEEKLREELLKTSQMPHHEACERILELNKKHDKRAKSVWAELGEAPLANALSHLHLVAMVTIKSMAAGTIDDMSLKYGEGGWGADYFLLKALSCVDNPKNLEAVQTTIRAIYLPWIDEAARYLQNLVEESGYPGDTFENNKSPDYKKGECILFVDGLRFDTAKRLSAILTKAGMNVNEEKCWSELPSVTATCKPAVSPVRHLFRGDQVNSDFEPSVASTGKSLKGGGQFYKLLSEAGWQRINRDETVDCSGRGWAEFADIDKEAHSKGWKLALHLESILSEIHQRVEQLLLAGWKSIHIVTDHGWLLLPGGLPKSDLPAALVENKWGRCAALKPGSISDEKLFPWFWNPNQQFALAEGVSCYRRGEEYAHGGLSLQECLSLELIVTRAKSKPSIAVVQITHIVWRGLRCKITLEGDYTDLSLDIRRNPANESTSIVLKPKKTDEHGMASLVVEDEDNEDKEATIVVIDEKQQIVTQAATVVGGGIK